MPPYDPKVGYLEIGDDFGNKYRIEKESQILTLPYIVAKQLLGRGYAIKLSYKQFRRLHAANSY
jgi:hypothetical protein